MSKRLQFEPLLRRCQPPVWAVAVLSRSVPRGRSLEKGPSITLPSGSQSFTTSFEYGLLGDIASIDYPRGDWPFQSAPLRQVEFELDLGFLTAVPGYAPSITYQLGGMLREIDYANGKSRGPPATTASTARATSRRSATANMSTTPSRVFPTSSGPANHSASSRPRTTCTAT
jgi:hypothetical protein